MKKLFFITFSCLIVLSGCKTIIPEVKPITSGIEFNAEISYLDEVYDYSVKIDKNGNLEMTDTGDTEIKYFFSGDKLTVSHKDISHETEISTLNKGNITDLLYSVFNSVRKSGKKVLTDNENYYLKNDTDKYSYTCYFGQTGLPLKIIESNFGVKVIIKNATVIKSNQ